jgi:hypothetical protein
MLIGEAIYMLQFEIGSVIGLMAPPAFLFGASAAACAYLERKDKPGISLVVKLGSAAAFVILWLLPMLDKILYSFSGVLNVWGN